MAELRSVHDDQGKVVDAHYGVEPRGRQLSLVFESCGGRPKRNTQYNRGLEILLDRLRALGVRLTRVEAETLVTLELPPAQRRVKIKGYSLPLSLASVDDCKKLRRAIGAGVAEVGREPGARGGGNRQKRLRLTFSGGRSKLDRAKVEATLDGPALPVVPPASARPRNSASHGNGGGGRGGGGGQGHALSSAERDAVEERAMRAATKHYEAAGWVVHDVSRDLSAKHRGYDLLCKKGRRRLHVEVKGTQGSGESVFLTEGEVRFAEKHADSTELFVLAEIQLSPSDSGFVARRGKKRVIRQWNPSEEGELKPKSYTYTLPKPKKQAKKRR
jgi:hypothetical protein